MEMEMEMVMWKMEMEKMRMTMAPDQMTHLATIFNLNNPLELARLNDSADNDRDWQATNSAADSSEEGQ
jgi:hypothetical protein